ncbi:MAG TPA: arginase family protein [Longimicrobiales bacterium]
MHGPRAIHGRRRPPQREPRAGAPACRRDRRAPGRARPGEGRAHRAGGDPSVAPAIVDRPVPGGLSLGQLETVLRGVAGRFRVCAAAVTTYDPALDPDERTLRVVLRIAELLAGADARPSRRDADSMSNSR